VQEVSREEKHIIDYCERGCRYGWAGRCHNNNADVVMVVATGHCGYKKPKTDKQINQLKEPMVLKRDWDGRLICPHCGIRLVTPEEQ